MALKRMEDLGALGQAKREQIIEAARRLFLERGFERTSMEAIREAAGVSKPTLYNHYENKETLFADVVRGVLNTVAGNFIPAIEADTIAIETPQAFRETLVSIGYQATSGLMRSDYLALVRLVVAETPRFPQLGEIFREVGPGRGIRLIATLLERAHARGVVHVRDPELAARLFFGPILSYVLMDGLIVAGEPRVPPRERIEAIADLVMRAISSDTVHGR